MGVPLRVLIVEDSEIDFLFLTQELRRGGYDPLCERVETGEAMSAALDRGSWDAILIDYTLPYFSGIAALELIKRMHSDLPGIIVSGTIDDETAVAAMKAGAHDYIMKNNLPRLIPALEREMRETKERQERRRIEKALQETEKKFFTVFQHSPVPMAITSIEEGRLFDVNEQYTRLMGFSQEELIGHTTGELNLWADPEERKRLVRSIERNHGEIQSYPMSVRTKSGNVIKVLFSADIIKINDAPYLLSSAVDITERLKAEEALRESEARYRQLVEYAPAAICEADLTTGRLLSVNEVLCEYSGYTRDELLALHPLDLMTEESQKLILQRMAAYAAGEPVPASVEYKARSKTGREFWISTNVKYFFQAGLPVRATVIAYDITERKQMEEVLQREKLFAESLVQTAQAIVLVLDPTGHIVSINPYMEDISGFPLNEVQGKDWFSTFLPEYIRDRVRGLFLKAIDDIQTRGTVNPIVTRDGRELLIEWYDKTLKDESGIIKGLLCIGHDVTERKQAEEALRRTEENFRLSLDDSPLGVRILTMESNTVYANRVMLNIYGYGSIEELKTTPLKERCTPESYAEYQIRKEKRKREGDRPSEYSISIVRKNGEVRHLQAFRKGILWNGEEQFQVIYQDISERRQAEEALRASREQLRALAERLQAVREEERTQIAREIHDELGGALTGLKIDFSFLTRAALKIENETVRTSFIASTDSMIKSIDATIQTVRRIAMELRPGILDDLGLVAALEWQLKDFEKRTGIRSEFLPPGEDISLDADLSTALFRIFQEALTNVARHSGATEVHVRLHVEAGSTTLEVEDNGKGIKNEKSLSSKSLGLLGMRERAQMFGGRITVTGTPGTGTTVTVDIPPGEKRKMDREQGGDAG